MLVAEAGRTWKNEEAPDAKLHMKPVLSSQSQTVGFFFFLSENIFILLWMTTLNPGKLGDKRARRLESAPIIRTSADIDIWKEKKKEKNVSSTLLQKKI